MKVVIQIVLWIVIIFLGYKLYNSVLGPVQFNKEKEVRYRAVIKTLKDVRVAQLAHQEIAGGFTGNFDSLVQFIDTAQFAIIQRRDTSYADVEKNRAYGIDEGYFIEETLLDTLGFVPVKDSLFGNSDRYKTMMNVPVEGSDAQFEMEAGTLEKNGTIYSVFECKVAKDVILYDKDKDLVAQEKQVNSVDGVNGEYIKIGSMDEINTSGSWPKLYDTNPENSNSGN